MKKIRTNNRGFTLIELLLVLAILGILAGFVMPRIFGQKEEANRTAAKVQIAALEDALRQFEVDNGFYPTTEQGLDALVRQPSTGQVPKNWRDGGYLQKTSVPKDPWGNPYVYISPGIHGDFDLVSYGSDNLPGGEGKFADVNNWDSN